MISANTVEGAKLVVYAVDGAAKLAFETTLSGVGAEGASRLSVYVDATTGALLNTAEHIMHGTGNGWIVGNVTLSTVHSGATYRLQDPSITSLSCQDATNNTTFSGPDDVWGNGNGTNRETGCVDALYAAQKEAQMFSSWLGRNGFNGSGGGWPIRVGLNGRRSRATRPAEPGQRSSVCGWVPVHTAQNLMSTVINLYCLRSGHPDTSKTKEYP